jgi:hypothetical protein
MLSYLLPGNGHLLPAPGVASTPGQLVGTLRMDGMFTQLHFLAFFFI